MNKWWSRGVTGVLALGLSGCALLQRPANLDYDPQQAHHRADGFVNRYAQRSEKPGLWRWQYERWRDGLPKPPQQPITGIAPDLQQLHSDDGTARVTWVGHATLLLQIAGINLLTDPHWGDRASPLSFAGPKRHQAPGVAFADLPRIDAVLISHNHYDHLHQDTVQRLMDRYPDIRFFVPLGVQYWFADHIKGTRLDGPDANVVAMDWDQEQRLPAMGGDITLSLLAVQHWSARGLRDRYATLWGSWAVLHPEFRFWFSGDLGYSQDSQDIGQRLGQVDLAAIALGAYAPRWFMRDAHINPEEALQVMRDVKAKTAIAIHWGTFEGLSDESLDQPPRDLAAALAKQPQPLDFRVLRHGETWRAQQH